MQNELQGTNKQSALIRNPQFEMKRSDLWPHVNTGCL
jgi:hypothetical protein